MLSFSWSWRPSLALSPSSPFDFSNRPNRNRAGPSLVVHASAENNDYGEDGKKNSKKVVIVGSGWAGLGAAHHLCKQGFDVTVLEDADDYGSPDAIGIQGFWYPYQNIFSLVHELGIKPFTDSMKSALYSREGLEVEFPIYQDLPQLPSPLGALVHTQFLRLDLVDRLTSVSLMAAVVDFDNTDTAWRKYDPITARELFTQFGFSEKLYQDVFRPMLQVGLFVPPEQCSAAATLAMLYYLILAHQKDFDAVWCRGTVKEKIFNPWKDFMRTQGCVFLEGRSVTDIMFDEVTGCISGIACGGESLDADAFILAVRISKIQDIIKNSSVLRTRNEFLKVMNLAGVDALSVKLRLDGKVYLPNATNVCSGDDNCFGWTFFDLNVLYDEHKGDPMQVIQSDFYYANELLVLEDDHLVGKTMSYLADVVKEFGNSAVVDREISRFPKSLTHFFPGSYGYMMRGSTSFPNLFMAGDWIINRHGSWSQEKSYVTGLEAANRVVDYLEYGDFAKIIPVEEDEQHIQALRGLNRSFNEIRAQLPLPSNFLW
ncbi:Amino_oxidase domain-containing protein [Psidium guajava]|nr:Amino_oxidase domain-containing protein [Psidium guajava]